MKIAIKDLSNIRARHKDQKIIFMGGTFDLLHIGHLDYLRKAREHGDILVVGINSDERTRRVKGSTRPIVKQAQRANMIANLKGVDYAFVMPKRPSRNLRPSYQVIAKLRPNIYLVPDKAWFFGAEFFSKYGTELILMPRVNRTRTSTSRIIKEVLKNHSAR